MLKTIAVCVFEIAGGRASKAGSGQGEKEKKREFHFYRYENCGNTGELDRDENAEHGWLRPETQPEICVLLNCLRMRLFAPQRYDYFLIASKKDDPTVLDCFDR